MSPMLLLTYVHCGGLTVRILSTHVGWSLISQQQPKHPSPLTWDSKAVSQAMIPDRESHWARRMLHIGQLWWSNNAHAAQQQWRTLIDGSRITGSERKTNYVGQKQNKVRKCGVRQDWYLDNPQNETLTKTKTMDLFCHAGAKITIY